MKKRILAILLVTILVFSFTPVSYATSNPISVTIDGRLINLADQNPTVVDGRTLVPVRGVFEELGFTVVWDAATSRVTLTGSHIIVIEIGSNVFLNNGTENTLDVPAQTIGGRTMLPLRLVLESVGYSLEWDASTQTVLIRTGAGQAATNNETAALWTFDRFSDIRDASFSTDLPHGEIAVGFIEYMSDNFAGRSAFTYTEKETAVWIIEELLAMGHGWNSIQVQEFDYWYLLDNNIGLFPPSWETISSPMILGVDRDDLLREDRVTQNVVLTIPGQSERFIIVGAHYDSVPYPGASDNASGVGLLLESAQRMIELDHYYTIVYVFFGAEEVGLFGAYYYYKSLTAADHENVVMMINADVLIEGPYPIFGAGMVPVIDDDTTETIISMTIESMLEEIEELLEQIPEEAREEALEEIAQLPAFIAAQLKTMHPIMVALQGYMMGLLETVETDVSRRVDAIANAVMDEHNVELIRLPEGVVFTSDNLAFAMTHTVVNLCGLERVENIDNERIPMGVQISDEFAATILHSPQDEFNTIEYLWPGMMSTNMQTFSLFLEAMLIARFS